MKALLVLLALLTSAAGAACTADRECLAGSYCLFFDEDDTAGVCAQADSNYNSITKRYDSSAMVGILCETSLDCGIGGICLKNDQYELYGKCR